jgi:hypothetical protein
VKQAERWRNLGQDRLCAGDDDTAMRCEFIKAIDGAIRAIPFVIRPAALIGPTVKICHGTSQ